MKLIFLAVALMLGAVGTALADSPAANWPNLTQRSQSGDWNHGVKLTTSYVWLDETEYLPLIEENVSRWQERTLTVQLTKAFASPAATGRIGLGYLDGTIKQENELFNDTDFALTRQAPFALLDWQWSDKLTSHLRLRYEQYRDDGRSGFYQLGDDETLWTGAAQLSYSEQQWWLNLSYARERDPEPIYDADNDRVALEITAQTLSGATIGWRWNPQWQSTAGIYYEAYGSDRPDQFNYTLQLTHQPRWLSRLRASLGVGYYTEERDTLVNLTLNYQQMLAKNLTLVLEYQCEYSDDEQSLLNQGLLALRYALNRQFAINISGEYSRESGDDRDDSLFAVASLEWNFD